MERNMIIISKKEYRKLLKTEALMDRLDAATFCYIFEVIPI